jgi:hypothetical protein
MKPPLTKKEKEIVTLLNIIEIILRRLQQIDPELFFLIADEISVDIEGAKVSIELL